MFSQNLLFRYVYVLVIFLNNIINKFNMKYFDARQFVNFLIFIDATRLSLRSLSDVC